MEQGLAGITLRAVGDRAGVSRMTPYQHFTDKADLLAAVATAEPGRYGLMFGPALQGDDHPEVQSAAGVAQRRLVDAVEAAQEANHLSASDASRLAALVYASCGVPIRHTLWMDHGSQHQAVRIDQQMTLAATQVVRPYESSLLPFTHFPESFLWY